MATRSAHVVHGRFNSVSTFCADHTATNKKRDRASRGPVFSFSSAEFARTPHPGRVPEEDFETSMGFVLCRISPGTFVFTSFLPDETHSTIPGLLDVELPINPSLFPVGVAGPGFGLRTERSCRCKPAAGDTLSGHCAQFVFGDIQPAAVLRCVAKFEATNEFTSPRGGKRFVECASRVSVQIVADKDHLFCFCGSVL